MDFHEFVLFVLFCYGVVNLALKFSEWLSDFLVSLIAPEREKRHWYSIEYAYYRKNGSLVFQAHGETGVKYQSQILLHRKFKDEFRREHMLNRSSLCNGILERRVICYMGYF